VTSIANICLFLLTKVKPLANVKAIFRTLILSVFFAGQLGAFAHAHEHEHEDETPHNVCALCILPVSDDDVLDDLDGPDLLDGPDYLKVPTITLVNRSDAARLDWHFSISDGRKSTWRGHLFDAARAPPFN